MAPTNQRAGKKPNADNLAAATAPRLAKAEDVDPVLGVTQAQQRTSSSEKQDAEAPREHAKASGKKAYPKKVSFYTTDEDSDRMRAAWNNLPVGVKPRTFSAFLQEAIMEKVTEAEEKYNGGQPWPSQPAGTIATGPPVGG